MLLRISFIDQQLLCLKHNKLRCEILNIAPGEGQIPLDRRTEPNWEALAFPKEFSTGEFHYNHPRDIKLTPI